MEDKKELIWVSAELKKQIDDMESDFEKIKLVEKFINQKKIDITSDIECLDDDLLRMKAFALKYKTEFEKVCDEQTVQLEQIFNKCSEAQYKTKEKVEQVKNELNNTLLTITTINKAIDNINTYKIENLITITEKFNRMSGEEKKLFEILIKNMSREDEE